MKSYTDLEQSKVLSKILPLESADMFYEYIGIPVICIGKPDYSENRQIIYAWSLVALLGIIPNYKLSSEHNFHTCTAETSFGKETVGWFDNPIDACVALIEKLHELNLL